MSWFAISLLVLMAICLVGLIAMIVTIVITAPAKSKTEISQPPPPSADRFEYIDLGTLCFKRKRKADVECPVGDWRWTGTYIVRDYDYWCPHCNTKLSDGPRGGAAVNAVCSTCKINYGCLPGFEGD